MGAVRGALVGGLGLVVLEVALTNATGVASLIQLVGGDGQPGTGLLGRMLSPDVAAIPNRAGNSPAAAAVPAPAGSAPARPVYPNPSVPPPVVAPWPSVVPSVPNSPNLN